VKVALLLLGATVLGLLIAPASAAPGGHYIPRPSDGFHYFEEATVGDGQGNYSSYSDATFTNGSETVNSVAADGTENASYSYAWSYSSSTGTLLHGTSSGTFTFSAGSFLYVSGTDNQTGYTNPAVWFYMNNSLSAGKSFELLNTQMTVLSTNTSEEHPAGSGEYVRTISSDGSGQYERDDSYGVFTASYTWQAYFDPSTGYIVGYTYTEQDTNGAGDGFTYTDVLSVTSTTYALTPASAPAPAASGANNSSDLLYAIVAVIVIVVVVVVIALALRSRRGTRLPQHSVGGRVEYGTVPMSPPPPTGPGVAPPPIRLTGVPQPAVQQVVIRETVKVNCRFCGTLIDSTATVCPNCGAPRT